MGESELGGGEPWASGFGTAMVPFCEILPSWPFMALVLVAAGEREDGKDTTSLCFFLLLSEQLFLFQIPRSHTSAG